MFRSALRQLRHGLLLPWLAAFSLPVHAADLVLPLSFNAYATPMLRLPTSQLPDLLALDTGSAEGLHLTGEQLLQLDGVHFSGEIQRSIDLAGRTQRNPRFTIDTLRLGEHVLQDIPGVMFSPWGLALDAGSELPDSSVIGLGFFAGQRIVLDYAASTLTMLEADSDFSPQAEHGWIEVPFHLSAEGLTLDTTIDGLPQRMSLDSGATLSFVIADRIADTRAAVPCHTIYDGMPEQDCRLLPIQSELGQSATTLYAILIDHAPTQFENTGLFGGDFLQQHTVYVDFPGQQLFVRPLATAANASSRASAPASSTHHQ